MSTGTGSNALDPSAIISLLPSLLPEDSKKLQSGQDAIAALFHSAMSALAFRLIAVDDTAPPQPMPVNALPDQWNKHGPGHYTLRYRHDQSSLEFVVKLVKLGNRTLINAIANEGDKISSLDVSTNDFVSPSFFPHDIAATDAAPLVHGFISSNRVTDLLSQFKLQIIQKLIPGLRKDGYNEESVDSASSRAPTNPPPARPQPEMPPYAPGGNPYSTPPHFMRDNPLEIGRRDLDPFPANPFGPPSLFPDPDGNGMFVGPNHPMFAPRNRNDRDRGPWGGDGFLPSIGAPPGARFDPVGPDIGPFPGFGRGRGRGGVPRGGNMQGPDNDEFMPPGAGDMFM
jgi:hypothetical protein